MTVYSVLDERNPCHRADTCTLSPECERYRHCEAVDRQPVNGLNFEALAELRQGSFEMSGTFDGDLSAWIPPPQPRDFTYVVPHRRRRWSRWEIVEYTGQVAPGSLTEDADGGFSVSFEATGPLTRTVHTRRFWLLWSAKRYLRRLQEAR